ncbi:50S ribosomal protein L25 [candidate division WOR-3 bacterium]|nr:50S ribosomal protein L25 [candidate division WOR-3 bacterium]MCK4528168.1 50S ribosomal protein L25 [candidate division WOR-3 bacterium]
MKIEVKSRNKKEIGSNRAKHIRKEGWIPGVIYGHGEKSSHIKLKEEELRRLIHELRSEATLITLNHKGKELLALIREVVRDPLTENLLHVDFQHIHENEEVTTYAALNFEGESAGVKEGGILNIEHRQLTIKCLPKDMLEEIVVDISNLEIGDSIHIKDLDLPERIKIEEDPGATIVNVLSPRKVVEVKTEEEELLLGEEIEEPELVSEEGAEKGKLEEKEETKE